MAADALIDWFRRPIPFGLLTVWIVLLVALFIVQALAARDRGDRPWWDIVTTSVVVVGSGLGFYFGALTGNFSGLQAPSPLYFDINRGWLGIGALVGIPLLAGVLIRDTLRLIRRRRRQIIGHRVTVLTGDGRVMPEVRIEVLRDGDALPPGAPMTMPEVQA